MINKFLVRAYPDENELKIILDGYFMKSELNLALQLARLESKKLMPGFNVLLNINNLSTPNQNLQPDFKRFEKIIKILGGGSLKIAGPNTRLPGYIILNVGFYPYEIAWFL